MSGLLAALLIGLFVGMDGGSSLALRGGQPGGWRYPQESDYVGDWQKFKDKFPIPFHVTADFNNDGIKDDVWLMIRSDNNGWAIFAFLGRKVGKSTIIRIESGQGKAQRYGISLANPGTYRTACGKGYFACSAGEPESVTLKSPGFELFLYESGSVLYFWDERLGSFRKVHVSD